MTETDYLTLAGSWITPEIADEAMLRRVDEHEGREIVGQKGKRDCSGILICYYWPGDPHLFNYRLRRDKPDWTEGKDGKPKPKAKYLGPPNSGNRLYIPPGVTMEQLADVESPIALVEGEKKALALWRLARNGSERPRFIPIAIAGGWNWRGRIGKTNGPNGERLDVTGPIADLSRVPWKSRETLLIYDANVHTNDSLSWARKGLNRELASRGAQVQFVNLPEDCGVNGIDDLLAAWGPARVLELFQRSVSGARLQVVGCPQFQWGPDGMLRITNKGERSYQTQLTNYRASIITNIRLDDGVETRREFELEAELMGRKFRFAVSASEFARMDWPIERLGPAAITFPSQRDYARTAIQSFSMAAEERCIYTHTGWREVDGRWLFLHGGGAISGSGAVPNINVRLTGAMSRYELLTPAGRGRLACAIKASLRLVELGPPSISFPLFAATCRAVFGNADFAVHLAGATGAFKSEVAALHQQHFGAAMNRLHLPGAWSSSGNALEVLAFQAKDSLFVIDDFAPQGSGADIARYHAAADRVFRAAGNHAGRGRLDCAAALRESKPPRALILSTGEDIPRGQSVRARLLILEIEKGSINGSDLAECQREAQRGLYAEATGGFVQFLATRYEEVRAVFDKNVSQYRAETLAHAAHARTPDIVANLQAAFEMYLQFAEECGAVTSEERIKLVHGCRHALLDAARAQSKHQVVSEPTEHFLAQVRAALACGKAHLASPDNIVPELWKACGWRRTDADSYLPLGDRIGWIEEDAIYLEPTASYRIAQLMAHDAGEGLSVTPQTLRKRLKEKALLVSVDHNRETLTVRRRLGGSSKEVLHLARSIVLPESRDDQVENVG